LPFIRHGQARIGLSLIPSAETSIAFMLREIHAVKQHPGELRRRWFAAESMDLFVWYGDSGTIVGFQLSYDKPHAERAITWKRDSGFTHTVVDDGARPGKYPETPLLVVDGVFAASRVLRVFQAQAMEIDDAIVHFVSARLIEFPREASASGLVSTGWSGRTWGHLYGLVKSVLARLRR